jgi:hypothetical protein
MPEKNTKVAFQRSFEYGFGTETDLRDRLGEIVISHDMPCGEEITLDDLLSLVAHDSKLLAINIKADGLAKLLSKAMEKYSREKWFVFDMSIPDMRNHLEVGNPVFARMSEVEHTPPWFEKIEGIWLDSFSDDWFDLTLIETLISQGKRVCVVSPELHGRHHLNLWNKLLPIASENRLILCTDFPVQAKEFFISRA